MIPTVRFRAGPAADGRLIVPLPAGAPAPPACAAAAAVARFTGDAGMHLLVLGARPMVLVGLGDASPDAVRRAGAAGIAALIEDDPPAEAGGISLDARGLPPGVAASLAAAACGRAWRPERWLKADPTPPPPLTVAVDDVPATTQEFARAAAVLEGQDRARTWTALPANLLGPAEFAQALAALAETGLEVTILSGKRLGRAGLGGLVAVGQGSVRPPVLAVLRWRGTLAQPPLALVGKGLCFDTGGVCIKPAQGMEEMRGDMGGAASCAGAMIALARRRSPAPVVAVLALAENATGAAAYRPSDVLRLADGTTVEVVDTDAEGRLVLADAMAWARRRFQPSAMVTVATLTGSVIVALGHELAGLFATDDALAGHVGAAGHAAGEGVWRLPIGARHTEDLRSAIADIRHCTTGRLQPDASHAAAFLASFAVDTPWAHLDIAGVDSRAEADDAHAAGPSGFGVALLDRLVAQRFETAHRA